MTSFVSNEQHKVTAPSTITLVSNVCLELFKALSRLQHTHTFTVYRSAFFLRCKKYVLPMNDFFETNYGK